VFGGVVFQGEAKAGKSWRQGGAKGQKREHAGAVIPCLSDWKARSGAFAHWRRPRHLFDKMNLIPALAARTDSA
jgi:hypothetical protein